MTGTRHSTSRLAAFHDLEPRLESFRDAVIDGLSQPRKRLPCKFFYDAAGSALFDRICELPEYYPTRTEMGILAEAADEIARLLGPGCQLIELGSGSSRKVRLLLDRLMDPAGYVAIDISRDHLLRAAEALAEEYPRLPVMALCADYSDGIAVPPPPDGMPARQVAFFPGSTIGNMSPIEAADFLAGWARHLSSDGRGGMLIGVDLKKDEATLNAAYNDAAGVTAAFNLNLLARINRELAGSFDLERFRHRAFYCPEKGRIEMHLVSTRNQIVRAGGQSFALAEGEGIHTENSYKYTVEEFRSLAVRAGFRPERTWTDPGRLFSVHYLAT